MESFNLTEIINCNLVEELYNITEESYKEAIKLNNGKTNCEDVSVNKLKHYLSYIKQSEIKDNNYYNKTNYEYNNGRFYSKSSCTCLHNIFKSYLFKDTCYDVDIKNCWPSIIHSLLIEYKLNYVLQDYINNPKEYLEKNYITKKDVLKMINNENEPFNDELKKIHKIIYNPGNGLISTLKELKQFKKYYIQLSKKETDNIDGKFISYVCRYYESLIIKDFIEFCRSYDLHINTYSFDGVIIKTDNLTKLQLTIDKYNELDFSQVELKPFNNFITFIKKDWKIYNWTPTKNIITEFDLGYLQESSLTDDNKINFNISNEYLNNFIAIVYKPTNFLYKTKINDKYQITNKLSNLNDIFGFNYVKSWINYPKRKTFNSIDFIIDKNIPTDGIYNLYKRPTLIETNESIENISPEIYNYLFNILSNGDSDVYNYLIKYISFVFQKGCSKQSIVLTGEMGTGKSSFLQLLSCIVGGNSGDYCHTFNNIDKFIKDNFNSHIKECIFIGLEELNSDSSKNKEFDNILKDCITREYNTVNDKYVSPYKIKNVLNYILISNYFSPIKITDGNRRHLVLKIDSKWKKHNEVKCIYDIMNNDLIMGKLRYYFYNYDLSNVKLLDDYRPTTIHEKILNEKCKTPLEKFVSIYNFGAFEINNYSKQLLDKINNQEDINKYMFVKGKYKLKIHPNRLFNTFIFNYQNWYSENYNSSSISNLKVKQNLIDVFGFDIKKYGKSNNLYILGNEYNEFIKQDYKNKINTDKELDLHKYTDEDNFEEDFYSNDETD